MESSDGDGDSTTAIMTKASLIFLFILPAALYKPAQKTVSDFAPDLFRVETAVKKESPPCVSETPKEKKEALHHF